MKKARYLWIIGGLCLLLAICTFALGFTLKKNAEMKREAAALYRTNHQMARYIEIMENVWMKDLEDLKQRNDSAEARINRFHKILE